MSKINSRRKAAPKDQFWSMGMMSWRQAGHDAATPSTTSYSFSLARNALYHSLKQLGIASGEHILVPAYVCRAAIDPLLAFGVNVDFYAINRNCEPIVADLEQRIGPQTKAILLVHYFGFPQTLRSIRSLCSKYNLMLIEDCAHVLCGENEGAPIGRHGDAAVFSWRKFLPITDGAELLINRQSPALKIDRVSEGPWRNVKSAINLMENSLAGARRPHLELAYKCVTVAERVVRGNFSRPRKADESSQENCGVLFELQSVNTPMSRLSQWIRAHSNIGAIVEKRRQNYSILRDLLSSFSRTRLLYPELPRSICPWVFPVVFEGISDAHLELRAHNVPAVAWDGVRHPGIPPGEFQDADFLYRNLVFLPIHQCMLEEDVVRMAQVIKNALT